MDINAVSYEIDSDEEIEISILNQKMTQKINIYDIKRSLPKVGS